MGSMEGEAEESSLAESGCLPINNGRPGQMSKAGFRVGWGGNQDGTWHRSEASEFKLGRLSG